MVNLIMEYWKSLVIPVCGMELRLESNRFYSLITDYKYRLYKYKFKLHEQIEPNESNNLKNIKNMENLLEAWEHYLTRIYKAAAKNSVIHFAYENLQYKPRDMERIAGPDVYTKYEEWFPTQYKFTKIMSYNEFMYWIKIKRGRWTLHPQMCPNSFNNICFIPN